MELIYYYAKGHNNRPPQGHNFSNKYIVTYDEVKGDLDFKINQDYIEDFFGSNITSLTAFVGENGAGKTTLLNLISRTVIHGNRISKLGDFDFFAVYKHGTRFYYYELEQSFIKTSNKQLRKAKFPEWISHLKDFTTIYFSQHIENLYSDNRFNSGDESMYPGRYDISTSYIYRQLVSNNSKRISEITGLFRKEENRKYLKLLKNVNLGIEINLPRYLTLKITNVPGVSLNEIDKNKSVSSFLNKFASRTSDIDHLEKSIIEGTIWQIASSFTNRRNSKDADIFFEGLDILRDKVGRKGFTNSRILDSFWAFSPEAGTKLLETSISLIYFIREVRKFGGELTSTAIYFEIKKVNLKLLLSSLDKIGLFDNPLQFLEVAYNHDRLSNGTYSSGEYAILGLFSRLYDKLKSLTDYNIILLDEAEIHLHPLWQRQFIQVLLDFLNTHFGNKKFQVVLTSHSPVILSDTPKWSVTHLKSTNQGLSKIDFPETFGANIHELYSSGFGLGGNLVGEFATRKIQSLVKELYGKTKASKSECELYLKRIKMVAEPFIREKLLDKINELAKSHALELIIRQKEEELIKLKANRKTSKAL